MERWTKAAAALLGLALAAAGASSLITRPVAVAEVRPVENRVTALEAQRISDRDRLDRIENKIDRVLERIQRREDRDR